MADLKKRLPKRLCHAASTDNCDAGFSFGYGHVGFMCLIDRNVQLPLPEYRISKIDG